MKNLSKREKVLLYVLVFILIFVGGGFMLCLPAFEKYTDLNTKYETAQMQWLTTKAGIVEYKDLDKQIEAATNAYNEQLKNFYIANETNTEDIDKLITTLAINHNLKPVSLNVSEANGETVINYKDYIQQKGNTDTEAETDTATNADAEAEGNVTVYNVSLSVTGSIASLQAMVNDVAGMKALKVAEVSYTNMILITGTMEVSFKVYMI